MAASVHIMELEQMQEVMRWLRDFCPEEHKRMLCITFQYERPQGRISGPETFKCSISEEHWNKPQNCLKAHQQDLTKTSVDNRPCRTRASLFCFDDLSLDRQMSDESTTIANIGLASGMPWTDITNSFLMDKIENLSRIIDRDARKGLGGTQVFHIG